MGLFDKKISLISSLKEAATKASNTIQGVDMNDLFTGMKETVSSVTEKTIDVTRTVCINTKEKTSLAIESFSEEIKCFDYAELKRVEYYQEQLSQYKDLGTKKISECFRSTFEVDKSTMEIVDDVRSRLPVPAKTVDEIFEQCKREAIRRAISVFALNGILEDIDNLSEAKYANLSESYKEFNERSGFSMVDDPNYATMKDIRWEARENWMQLKDGYNKDQQLDPFSADIDHVIAKKELYNDPLLRIGTTDDEFYSLINSKENLVFTDESFNRSMKETNIHDFLSKRGQQDPFDPDIVHVDIPQQDGSTKTVIVNRKDIEESYGQADEKRKEHRITAVKEVGLTVMKTGVTMAAQQIVGLIVLETVDIFVDELRNFTVNGRIINEDGWIQNTKDATTRVQKRLAERFEERQIMYRAKSLGIEAGVTGALSVIPQILISLIIKMPAFVLGLIRECTLSTLRSVRVLLSDDDDKFGSIKVLLAGATAAIVGVYVSRVISTAISGVPLLNRFNSQFTNVMSGLLITAVPLTAIYTFEQNKNKLSFIVSRLTKPII